MTQQTMYDTIIGKPFTVLKNPYHAGTDSEIYLDDASFLPIAENTATIWIADMRFLVTIKYTAKISDTLTGVTVVQGYPLEALTATFPAGSILAKPLAQTDVQTIQDNIRDLGTEIGGRLPTQYTEAQDGYIARVDSLDHKLKVMPGSMASVAFADITGYPTDNSRLALALSNKVSIREGSGIEMGEDANGLYIWV